MPLANQILTWSLLLAECLLFVVLRFRLPAFNAYLILPILYSAASLRGYAGAATNWRAALYATGELAAALEAFLVVTDPLAPLVERATARWMALLCGAGFAGVALAAIDSYADFDPATYVLRIGLHIFCFGLLLMAGLYVGLNARDAPLFALRHCALMLVYFGSMIAAASVRDRESYWIADGANIGVHLACAVGWIWLTESAKPDAR